MREWWTVLGAQRVLVRTSATSTSHPPLAQTARVLLCEFTCPLTISLTAERRPHRLDRPIAARMPTLTLTPLALLDDPECLPVDCAFDAQTLHDVLRGLVLSRRESVMRQVASMRCMSGELHESERSMRAADAGARAAEAKAKEAVARAAIERRLLSQELASSELRVVRLAYRLEQEAASAQQYRHAAAQHQQAAAQHQQAAAQHLATSMRAVAMLQEREKQPPPPPVDGEVRTRLLMQLELEAQRRAAAEESSRVLASVLADCALSTKPSATCLPAAAAAASFGRHRRVHLGLRVEHSGFRPGFVEHSARSL